MPEDESEEMFPVVSEPDPVVEDLLVTKFTILPSSDVKWECSVFEQLIELDSDGTPLPFHVDPRSEQIADMSVKLSPGVELDTLVVDEPSIVVGIHIQGL